MHFIMAVVASVSMELESLKGLLWYWYYRLRYFRY